MTCPVVEGSSCALDLVCVVLPWPVIGSRLLATACPGGFAAWVQFLLCVIWWAFRMPSHVSVLPYTAVWQNTPLKLLNLYNTSLCYQDLHLFWTVLGLSCQEKNDGLNMIFGRWKPFFSLLSVANNVVLSRLFVHYHLCIIRQTIIPLCFASVVQMLTGNESPQRLVKGRCYYQKAIHSQPIIDETITFKKSSAERERLLIWALFVARRDTLVFMRSQRTFWSKSIKNSSHSLTSCYVPSLGYSVVFRSFLTSICLSLFGSGDRSTCSTPLLPWKYPGLLGALQSDDSSVFLFLTSLSFPAHIIHD